jgi:hypothetical protein
VFEGAIWTFESEHWQYFLSLLLHTEEREREREREREGGGRDIKIVMSVGCEETE